VRQANERGRPIPKGWGLDREGHDTTDPADVIDSLALLPIAGAKGFGLGLMHEILTSGLMGGHLFGAGATGFSPPIGPMNVSQYFQAINVDCFMPIDEFRERMDDILTAVSNSAPRPGYDRVYYPGERSALEQERRQRDGIPVTRKMLGQLSDWCVRKQIRPPAA
jgi:LDH2 family malate/lactate/ureidoglycolate dehydrogenase